MQALNSRVTPRTVKPHARMSSGFFMRLPWCCCGLDIVIPVAKTHATQTLYLKTPPNHVGLAALMSGQFA